MTENTDKDNLQPLKVIDNIEEPTARELEVKAIKDLWSSFNQKEIENQINRLNFIVDPWGCLNEYDDLVLAKGWGVQTTSREVDKPGTIFLSAEHESKKVKLNKIIKQYISNHGLTLAQADTVIETRYYAKFKVLPLLTTVLNDKFLYRVYRSYSRNQTLEEYFAWIRKNSLQHNLFNITLTTIERIQISEMLERMVKADIQLRPMRDKMRTKFKKETA